MNKEIDYYSNGMEGKVLLTNSTKIITYIREH